VQRAAVVDLHVDQRIGHRVHHGHLGRQVNDALDGTMLGGQRRQRGKDAMRDIASDDIEPIAPGVLRQIRALAGPEVIQDDDVMAGRDQAVDGVRADEPGAAGNNREHARTIHGRC
jgi:hypothetical protein